MTKLKSIFNVSRMAYINWITNPRILFIPLTWIFFCEMSIFPMQEHAVLMETPLNVLEPFIIVTNSSMVVPTIPIFFLLLVSDCPRIGSGELFVVSRAGKLRWLIGQMLFFVYAAMTYLASLFVFCCAMVMKSSFIANGWSDVTRFIHSRPDIDDIITSKGGYSSIIEVNLFMHSRPYEACIRSFFLMLLYLLVISGIVLLFNVLGKKIWGTITSIAVSVLGLVTWAELGSAMWAFPMANSIFGWHNVGILSKKVYPVANSYIYFAIVLTLLFILSCIAIKKSNINTYRNES